MRTKDDECRGNPSVPHATVWLLCALLKIGTVKVSDPWNMCKQAENKTISMKINNYMKQPPGCLDGPTLAGEPWS